MMKPFIPELLPLNTIRWDTLAPYFSSANQELGRFDGILQGMINPMVLLSPLATQEAVLSSKIEGTVTTIEEVLEYEALHKQKPEGDDDLTEVINYRNSVKYAIDRLDKQRFNINLSKNIHDILLDSVRGKNKKRGEFRAEQNWIGAFNAKIDEASYVPPPHGQVLPLMENLEEYLHSEEKDPLVQLAIIHAQFELIHPFMDGNGRVGRILVPLFLFYKGLLSKPVFYASAYLEKHRDVYIDKLNRISKNNEWNEWVMFFLIAIREQAKVNVKKSKDILALYDYMKVEITHEVRTKFSLPALDTIFEKGIFNKREFMEYSGISKDSARRILNVLKKRGVLKTLIESSGRRSEVLYFPGLFEIVND